MNEISVVGYFSEIIISKLNLEIAADSEILLSQSTLSHIKNKHEEEYNLFLNFMADIITFPDYARVISDAEIRFIKLINNTYVCIPVRKAGDGSFYIRSLFRLHKKNVERFIKQNLFISLTNG